MSAALEQSSPGTPIRVLLVDDSGVSRALMTRWINESGRALVSAVAASGGEAVIALQRTEIDVVVLDVEMPGGGGLAALPFILATRPGVRVLMASALTEQGAQVTLEALRLGAGDAIAKPRAGWATRGGTDFPQELVERIVALGGNRAEPPANPTPPREARALIYGREGGVSAPPQAVVIGASTGGPNALFEVVAALPADLPVPVLVVQHLPAMFTAALARQLSARAAIPVREAVDGMPVTAGTLYLAPGGQDMTVRADHTIALWSGGEFSIGRPSVDALMESAVDRWGGRVLGVILSGMGQDGLAGSRAIVEAGGAVIAQDQATAMIWGMPGAVARAGLAREVLAVGEIGPAIVSLASAEIAESR